jgi:hypothetical protein
VTLWIHATMRGHSPARVSPFGHLRLVTGAHPSPELFAVYHVLPRQLAPRHPPCALSSLSHMCYGDRDVLAFRYALVNVLRSVPRGVPPSTLGPTPRRTLPHGDEGIRTPDLCRAKAPLSRPELRPPVGLTRLERVTSRLSGECSNQLSYRPLQALSPQPTDGSHRLYGW